MDYQFSFDALHRPIAHCSMEHEAFGDWLTHDLKDDAQQIKALLSKLDTLLNKQGREFHFKGQDYRLTLTQEDAILRSTQLHNAGDPFDDVAGASHSFGEPFDHSFTETEDLLFDDDQEYALDPDDLSIDDQQGHAMCGLEDFQALLTAWQNFLQSGS
ncbi:YacL family protein [Litoribrevibacter albus]|uniref:Uncharacterized protein n=1 Tax=Litoribrevibacter albus TaxID=1473156 RepID=A0AA37S7I4_9GAMM|nr:YacL family protein [Litoribrevibacter albus]GLQ30517.1 hypothetical protein GCM10007876_09950 [Litoribrevibacter albus]